MEEARGERPNDQNKINETTKHEIKLTFVGFGKVPGLLITPVVL